MHLYWCMKNCDDDAVQLHSSIPNIVQHYQVSVMECMSILFAHCYNSRYLDRVSIPTANQHHPVGSLSICATKSRSRIPGLLQCMRNNSSPPAFSGMQTLSVGYVQLSLVYS